MPGDRRLEAELNRILLVAYIFKVLFAGSVPNKGLEKTSRFKAHQTYKDARNRVERDGLIVVKRTGKHADVELTDLGMERVLELLSITQDTADIRDAFIHKLRVFTLFPIRLSEEERESLFRSLILLYSDSCYGRFVDDLLAGMSGDYGAGFKERLWHRLDYAVTMLRIVRSEESARLRECYISLSEGYRLLDRYAYLAYLWSLFRFNRLALHMVVRLASITLSGVYGTLLKIIYGSIFILLLQSFTVEEGLWLSRSIFIGQAATIFMFILAVMFLLSALGRFALLVKAYIRGRGDGQNR